MTRNAAWLAFGLAWLALIGWLTLRSAPDQASQVAKLPWSCLVCGDAGLADVFLNILLFLPLGITARALRLSLGRTLLIIVPITVGIETTQGLFLVGRDAALGDVLSNSCGGALGWSMLPLLVAALRPSRELAFRTLRWLAPATASIWFATGIGFRPALAARWPYTGQIGHRWPDKDPFPGHVTGVKLNGVPVPDDRLATNPAPLDSVALAFTAERTADPSRSRSASLIRIVDRDSDAQLTVNERAGQVLFQIPLRASRWLLHTPTWRFDGALDIPLDTLAAFAITATARDVAIRRSGAETMSAHFVPSLGKGWVFIHPFTATLRAGDYQGRTTVRADGDRLWTLLWLGWWFGLMGWFAGAAGIRAVAATIVLAVTLYVGASIASGVELVGWELIAGMVALVVAAALARGIARRRAGPERAVD